MNFPFAEEKPWKKPRAARGGLVPIEQGKRCLHGGQRERKGLYNLALKGGLL